MENFKIFKNNPGVTLGWSRALLTERKGPSHNTITHFHNCFSCVYDVLVFYFYNIVTCVYIVAALCLFVICPDDGNRMVTKYYFEIMASDRQITR